MTVHISGPTRVQGGYDICLVGSRGPQKPLDSTPTLHVDLRDVELQGTPWPETLN